MEKTNLKSEPIKWSLPQAELFATNKIVLDRLSRNYQWKKYPIGSKK
jgi:hypothetical protein